MAGSIVSWQNLDKDSGSALAAKFYLSRDMNVSPSNALNTDFTFEADGVLLKAVCEALYFPLHSLLSSDSGIVTARYSAQSRVEALRAGLLYSPPEVKSLARGKAVAVNASNNFGDLVDDVTGIKLLGHCWLQDIAIIDGQFIEGVKLRLTFAAVSGTVAP